jgi:mono/diheme cytochrome c family protein
VVKTLAAAIALVCAAALIDARGPIGQERAQQEGTAAPRADAVPRGTAAAAPRGDAARGRKLYTDDGCYQCHGRQGQGAVSGPRLAPRPIPFAAFSRYVRRPTAQMPPYTVNVLPEAGLVDIYAFLESIPASPPATALPLLTK